MSSETEIFECAFAKKKMGLRFKIMKGQTVVIGADNDRELVSPGIVDAQPSVAVPISLATDARVNFPPTIISAEIFEKIDKCFEDSVLFKPTKNLHFHGNVMASEKLDGMELLKVSTVSDSHSLDNRLPITASISSHWNCDCDSRSPKSDGKHAGKCFDTCNILVNRMVPF